MFTPTISWSEIPSRYFTNARSVLPWAAMRTCFPPATRDSTSSCQQGSRFRQVIRSVADARREHRSQPWPGENVRYTGERRLRPRRRRRLMDLRPLDVFIRARKPCFRTFLRLLLRRLTFTATPQLE